MIEIPVHTLDGNQTETLSIDEQQLGGEVRPALLKQAYVMYHANRRQGSAHTRNRAEKSGSNRKLYRQKGTGRARRGAVRTNIMRGGGVAFGKHAQSFRQKMPTKMRRLAARNALLSKIHDGELKLVDSLGFDEPKTKRIADALGALGIDRTCLLALRPEDRHTALSARNIQHVQTIRVDQLNAFDLLSRRFLMAEKDALLAWIEGRPVTEQQEAA